MRAGNRTNDRPDEAAPSDMPYIATDPERMTTPAPTQNAQTGNAEGRQTQNAPAEPEGEPEIVEIEAPPAENAIASAPDEEDAPEAGWDEEFPPEQDNEYSQLFAGVFDDADDLDPLDEELLTEEEQAELRRSHWQLLSGLADFAGVIIGTAAILVLMTLLVSLINWLVNDVSQSFILLQKNL